MILLNELLCRMAVHVQDSCVRGYHIYHSIWDAAIGEHLECRREPLNHRDRYAVAVLKDDVIIGHIPRTILRICSLFLLRNGTISCIVTGPRRYSGDLPQGGVEIPCKLVFDGSNAPEQKEDVAKLKRLIKRKLRSQRS